MSTVEIRARREVDPETVLRGIKEEQAERQSHRRVYRYEIGRGEGAITILLFGLGFLALFIGLTTGVLSMPHGFVAAIALWVLAATLRSYWGRSMQEVTIDYEPRYRK